MRTTFGCVAAGLLALVIVCPVLASAPPAKEPRGRKPSAEDSAAARAVIDKAIQAAGGEEKLAHFKTQTWKEKGVFFGLTENGLPYMAKFAVQWPDRFRMEVPSLITMVLNGDRGWTKERETIKEMPKDQLAAQLEEHYAGHVTTLLPLKDPAFRLSLLQETSVDGQPAVGVQISRQGHRDVKLYFDKHTGLLSKSDWRANDMEHGGKEVDQEVWYKNYKVIDGAKIPMKIVIKRDGKLYLEAENFDLKAGVKLDPKLFEKPE